MSIIHWMHIEFITFFVQIWHGMDLISLFDFVCFAGSVSLFTLNGLTIAIVLTNLFYLPSRFISIVLSIQNVNDHSMFSHFAPRVHSLPPNLASVSKPGLDTAYFCPATAKDSTIELISDKNAETVWLPFLKFCSFWCKHRCMNVNLRQIQSITYAIHQKMSHNWSHALT